MLPIAILLPTWKMVIETLGPVLDILYESLHDVLQFCAIYI
ncbi:hypothetical protein Ngar_c25720 [Candidatus Nitrososphaera gargensis Ga9.2]|uniref:Uncharacterized protein n=1 Tax=Nitrososphaera gargensis (strain Ga9.2) TaxID=1237085 RepID=K0INJ7_NITGG|nr:hypothetical protein Ngar_c25720 [Candidatus Nitrososphaera gargensis Ga9.2]